MKPCLKLYIIDIKALVAVTEAQRERDCKIRTCDTKSLKTSFIKNHQAIFDLDLAFYLNIRSVSKDRNSPDAETLLKALVTCRMHNCNLLLPGLLKTIVPLSLSQNFRTESVYCFKVIC